jgi:hypothetical protein
MRSNGAWAYVAIAVTALELTACSGGSSSMPPPATYTVGGSISGLTAAGLVLGNASDSYAAGANATTFTFATALQSGSSYSVTVSTQPAGLTCTVAAGSGTVAASNVSSVMVSCSPRTYTIGGTISGLSAGGLMLANGSDTVSPAAARRPSHLP